MTKSDVGKELVVMKSLLHKDLGFEDSTTNFDEFKENLQKFIHQLLDQDFELLLQALYRIDVKEEKVKEILTIEDPENLSFAITELIFERQMQKAVTRMRYR